jgi:hypothetical protein
VKTKYRAPTPAADSKCPKCKSSLVRRLVQAKHDPAKQRIRAWLSKISDERLLAFGLTKDDIASCRRNPSKS